jgi:hypothetical protein
MASRRIRRTSTLVSAALIALALTAASATSASADGATVVRVDSLCFLNAGNVGLFPCTIQRVETPSGGINVWLKGQAFAGTEPAETLHIDNASTGQICLFDAPTFGGTVTKSGAINIQCRN